MPAVGMLTPLPPPPPTAVKEILLPVTLKVTVAGLTKLGLSTTLPFTSTEPEAPPANASTRDDLAETVQALAAVPGVAECMIVSTCNRVELLAATEGDKIEVTNFLASHFAIEPEVLNPHLYEYHEKDAISHLFKVAASLDSMVVGEPQILGQVKEAFAVARAAGYSPSGGIFSVALCKSGENAVKIGPE